MHRVLNELKTLKHFCLFGFSVEVTSQNSVPSTLISNIHLGIKPLTLNLNLKHPSVHANSFDCWFAPPLNRRSAYSRMVASRPVITDGCWHKKCKFTCLHPYFSTNFMFAQKKAILTSIVFAKNLHQR